MKVTRTVSLDLDDLKEIDKLVNQGEYRSISDFVDQAVKTLLYR